MRRSWKSTTGTIDEQTGKLETTPILGAPFWKPGVKVMGLYVRSFQTGVGECYEFLAGTPFKVLLDQNGRVAATGQEKIISRFAMGALTGFEIAVQRLDGFQNWQYGDQMILECTGFQKAQVEGQSDMPMFNLEVSRP